MSDGGGTSPSRDGFRTTLASIREDVAAGRLARARARIHGVLASGAAPADALRLAGEIHARLGDPVAAGRYWWVVDQRATAEEAAAVEAFLHSTRGSDDVRIRASGIVSKFSHLAPTHEARWIPDTAADALSAARARRRATRAARRTSPAPGGGWNVGCGLAILAVGVFAFIGLLASFAMLRRAFE